jgi:hypothetical protein
MKITRKQFEKVDDRVIVLAKKYPLVFTAVLLIGAVFGFAIGRIL